MTHARNEWSTTRWRRNTSLPKRFRELHQQSCRSCIEETRRARSEWSCTIPPAGEGRTSLFWINIIPTESPHPLNSATRPSSWTPPPGHIYNPSANVPFPTSKTSPASPNTLIHCHSGSTPPRSHPPPPAPMSSASLTRSSSSPTDPSTPLLSVYSLRFGETRVFVYDIDFWTRLVVQIYFIIFWMYKKITKTFCNKYVGSLRRCTK